jgi:DNA-binding NarL/FixJ family response regulator
VKTNTFTALIVEDDRSWQEILTEILVDFGFQVDVCDDLQSAVSRLHATTYRLGIVDLSLIGNDHKNQDGLKVLQAIRQFAPNCVSILLTGYASVELAVDAIQEYGAFTCLQKETFRRVDFREIIRQALATPQNVKEEVEPTNENLAQFTKTASNELSSKQHLGLTLVVEDDAGWRSLLSELITETGFKVQTCTSYGEAQGLLKREHFQLAIVDLSLANSLKPSHNQDGYHLLARIREADIPTIIVSGSASLELIDRAYSEHNIFACLEKQSFDRKVFIETLCKIIAQKEIDKNLTQRELEVLVLVAQGYGNKEIAARLFISTNTVKRHLKSIFAKLDVNTRSAASAYAMRIGLAAEIQE